LKEYIRFRDKKRLWPSSEQLAKDLTMVGLEVESVDKKGEGIGEVVVAKVLECEKHPNADRLSLCKLTDGKDTYQVVCGAKNVRKDLLIAFAPIGSELPGGFKLKPIKIRGTDSQGMICSEKELRLSEESEGIMELDAGLEIGKPLIEALGLDDVVLDVSITPNRADCLSHIGIGREAAYKMGGELIIPEPKLKEKLLIKEESEMEVSVSKNGNICPLDRKAA